MTFFSFHPFSFFLTLFLFFISMATKRRIQSKHENNFSHKPNEIREKKKRKKKKRKERDLFTSKRINSISIITTD